MGTWGTKPWENDSAADWFGKVMDQSKLADRVRTELLMDAEKYPEIIRAAAHIVEQLGHVYIWPIQSLDGDLQLAVDALTKLAANTDMPRAEIRKSIRVLKSRLQPGGDGKATIASRSAAADESELAAKTGAAAESPRQTLAHLWSVDLTDPNRRKDPPGEWKSHIFEPGILDLAIVRDDCLLTSSGEWIAVLDASTGKEVWREDSICRNTFFRRLHTAQADHFVVTGPKAESVVRRLDDGKVLRTIAHGHAAASALSVDGTRLLILSRNGEVNLFDVESGELLREMQHTENAAKEADGCLITPDRRYGVTQRHSSVRIWDLESGKQIAKRSSRYAAQLTLDGTGLFCTDATGGSLVDIASGKTVRKYAKDQLVFPWNSSVSPNQEWIVDISRVRSNMTIERVRRRTDDHSPATQAQGRGVWLNNSTVAITRKEPVKDSPGEIQIWQVDPLTLIASVGIDRAFVTQHCGDPNYDAHFHIMRMAVDREHRIIFAGDLDGHVHAFAFPDLG